MSVRGRTLTSKEYGALDAYEDERAARLLWMKEKERQKVISRAVGRSLKRIAANPEAYLVNCISAATPEWVELIVRVPLEGSAEQADEIAEALFEAAEELRSITDSL